jgi:hypothetical protein
MRDSSLGTKECTNVVGFLEDFFCNQPHREERRKLKAPFCVR